MTKSFAWSFSRLKNYETCPLKYQQVDLLKNFKEAKSKELDWGDFVHKTFAAALLGQIQLPDEMADYKDWIDKVHLLPGELFVEQKYAIDKNFKPTSYFADNVWFRGIGDVVKVFHTRAAIIDWKTGEIKPDSVQLMLNAQCIFSHYPKVQVVHTAFVWLKYGTTTTEEFTREDLAEGWLGLYDRVASLETATKTGVFLPKPSGLCRKHCPVSTCSYYQKGTR